MVCLLLFSRLRGERQNGRGLLRGELIDRVVAGERGVIAVAARAAEQEREGCLLAARGIHRRQRDVRRVKAADGGGAAAGVVVDAAVCGIGVPRSI